MNVFFKIQDNNFLQKYNNILDTVSADIKKEFNSEPVYNKKHYENQSNNFR